MMMRMIRIPMAIACALGVSAASAQTVVRDGVVLGKAPQTMAQASSTTPIQLAQASGSAGGAATGATAGGAAAGVGFGTALIVVGAAVATIAVTVDSGSTVSH